MWFTIIMMLISYFTQKKKGVSSSKAALGTLAVGAGSYYVATQTDWGKATLGQLDTAFTSTPSATPLKDSAGNPLMDPVTGLPVMGPAPTTSKLGTSTFGAVGEWFSNNLGTVAAVAGGAAIGSSSSLVPLLLVGGAAYLLLRK